MPSLYPSPQAIYRPESVRILKKPLDSATASNPGDGFTREEVETALDPLKSPFNPTREYIQCDIGSLTVGPQAVTFTGRIVNFNTQFGSSKAIAAATGWHHIIVKDDTGGICVKLYFSNKPYFLRLGLLVTVWTTYIGIVIDTKKFLVPNAPNTTSIFPGREASVHIVIHENSDKGGSCRLPLGLCEGKPLPNLMTLKSFIGGGYEIKDSRVLGCVRSIGPTRNITNKNAITSDLTEVVIFDDTTEIVLKLWNTYKLSARDWIPNETILLVSYPTFRHEYRGCCSLGISHATMVDVNPDFPDADWLRKYAFNTNKKESMDQKFPADEWDFEKALSDRTQVLFTIADVDERVRADPQVNFTGYLNVTIMEIKLVLQHRRNMLMCAECCGVPFYGLTQQTQCSTCALPISLYLNPRVIGTLIDETGSIAAGKLLWSERAWEELFGRTVAELIAEDAGILSLMEQRIMGLRVHLGFGWAESVGRLAIWTVRM